MSTQTFVLTQTPTMIADGKKSVYIQEVRGKHTRFASSPTKPSTEDYAQILDNGLYFPEGFTIWAWSPTNSNNEVVVLTANLNLRPT